MNSLSAKEGGRSFGKGFAGLFKKSDSGGASSNQVPATDDFGDNVADNPFGLPPSPPTSAREVRPTPTPPLSSTALHDALLGNTMEFECILLNGDKLSLADLEGKVVLIDFWASWCGPCIGEVPGMRAAYDKYHDQGFEIIGYNVDWNSGEDVEFLKNYVEKESLPWYVSSAPACEKAGMVNYTNHYGVTGIPVRILVGKDGKIISTRARGQTLANELKKIFGN